LYHCTKRRYIHSIIKKGLLPKATHHFPGENPGVYLSKKPFDWIDMVTNKGQEAGAMIHVNVDGLQLIIDNKVLGENIAYISRETITPERFTQISISTKENPNHFEPLPGYE